MKQLRRKKVQDKTLPVADAAGDIDYRRRVTSADFFIVIRRCRRGQSVNNMIAKRRESGEESAGSFI